MVQNRIKVQIAQVLSSAFRHVFADAYAELGNQQIFNPEFIASYLEKPRDPSMGRYAFPVFRYGPLLKAKPPEIASKITEHANNLLSDTGGLYDAVSSFSSVAGFINAAVKFEQEASDTLAEILEQGSDYGSLDRGKGHSVLVEYSSANIAKPFGIGHLRTTILGNSLRLVFTKLGYKSIGINYLGDWGTQFGKMIVAYRKWGSVEDSSVEDLYRLYVKFHQEAEAEESLNDAAREAFKRLEDGDEEMLGLWQRFKSISLAEFDRVYGKLGTEFDWITGESFLNDKMDPVIERLKKAGLTSVSQDALIVDLNDPQLPPCLLKKADGATLYSTRDIAGLLYRWETYRFDEMLYVVGTAQSDHFKQVFKVIELLEEAEGISEESRPSKRVKHIDFGWVKFGQKMMATRSGNIVFLEDVIRRAAELAMQKIMEKNPDLEDPEETAQVIGVGAVIFSQLSVRRQKDINFDWDEVLSFEGETGPYLQYTHARLCSLLRNYGGEITGDFDVTLLSHEEERRVVELLADFPEAILTAARDYEPNFIATHLLKIAGAFNKVYQRKDERGRIDKIISEDDSLTRARMALVKTVQTVINEGLRLLGIRAPEEM